MTGKPATTETPAITYEPGTILSAETGEPVTFEEMLDDLASAQVIYIGERHTNPRHHEIQLEIIEALHQRGLPLIVGMEMFDRTYNPVLEKWPRGELEESELIERTHWYANWRYDYALYRPIMEFIRTEQVPLIGLNIPFHLPAKIATGGLDNLQPSDRKYLPEDIDLSDEAHRAYVQEVFSRHKMRGRDNFDYFYEAQTTWDEAMAESIAGELNSEILVVIVGGGHIVNKFGIPDRAYRRSQAPFRTIYLAEAGREFEPSAGDFVWITSKEREKSHPSS